jgi:hypothetical protein
MYWNIYGPQGKSNAYQWGYQQATAAVDTWIGINGSPYWQYTAGLTTFGTVIPNFFQNNWGYHDYVNNENCLEGWFDGIAAWSAPGSGNGLYTDGSDWLYAFPQLFVPTSHVDNSVQRFVLWQAPGNWAACNSREPICCAPCTNTCSTTMSEVKGDHPCGSNYPELCNVVGAAVGASQTVIWHYWPGCNPCTSQNHDVSMGDPNNNGTGFVPNPTGPNAPVFSSGGALNGTVWPTC